MDEEGPDRVFRLHIPTRQRLPNPERQGRFTVPPWLKPELGQIWSLAWSMTVIAMFSLLMTPVAIVTCGHLGTPALAGVAIATTVIHVSGTSVAIGLCTACDTVFSQAFGSRQKATIKVHLYRSIIIIMLFVFPCWAIHLNTESILLSLGQDRVVARIAGNYLLYFMPALPALFLQTILIQYLRCQDIIKPTVLVSGLGFLVNLILHYIFLFQLNFGTDGSALSLTVSFYVMAIVLIVYVIVIGTNDECGLTGEVFQEWGPFVSLAVGGLLMVVFEWWAYQIGVLASGTLGEVEVTVASILFQVLSLAYIFPLGIGLACNIRVGQLLGQQDIEQAKRAIRIALCLSLIGSLIINSLLLGLKHFIPQLFTSDTAIDAMVEKIIPVLVVLNIFDALSGTCVGVLRGCGRQILGSLVMFIGFYIIGLPFGIALLFSTELRVLGLYLGLLTGVMSHFGIFCIIIHGTKWEKEAENARRRTTRIFDESSARTDTNDATARVGNDELQSLLQPNNTSENRNSWLEKLQNFTKKRNRKVVLHATPELIVRRGTFAAFMVLIFIIGILFRFVILKHGSRNICPNDLTIDEFFLLEIELRKQFSKYCYDFYVREFLG